MWTPSTLFDKRPSTESEYINRVTFFREPGLRSQQPAGTMMMRHIHPILTLLLDHYVVSTCWSTNYIILLSFPVRSRRFCSSSPVPLVSSVRGHLVIIDWFRARCREKWKFEIWEFENLRMVRRLRRLWCSRSQEKSSFTETA